MAKMFVFGHPHRMVLENSQCESVASAIGSAEMQIFSSGIGALARAKRRAVNTFTGCDGYAGSERAFQCQFALTNGCQQSLNVGLVLFRLQAHDSAFFQTLNVQMAHAVDDTADAQGFMFGVYPCDPNIKSHLLAIDLNQRRFRRTIHSRNQLADW